jgi:hypothetical protein
MRVASGTVSDAAGRTMHEVDVAVFGHDDAGPESLLAIGEVTWQETMTIGHVRRLAHIRDLLRQRGDVRARATRLLCFSGAGFGRELVDEARADPTVQLVGLQRLYEGVLQPVIVRRRAGLRPEAVVRAPELLGTGRRRNRRQSRLGG